MRVQRKGDLVPDGTCQGAGEKAPLAGPKTQRFFSPNTIKQKVGDTDKKTRGHLSYTF